MEIGQSAAKSYAYLLGVFLGDGCVSTQGTYSQPTIDKDFADTVERAFRVLTDKTVTISYSERPRKDRKCSPEWRIYCGDKELAKRFVDDTKAKQVIPEYVFGWDNELKKQFVIGLMDSEGFVGANHSDAARAGWNNTNRDFYMGYKSCDVWVPEFIKVLESVGIRLGKVSQEKPIKPWHKIPTRFTIKMQSWIDSGCRFNIARKQNRVDEWASQPAYTTRPMKLCSESLCNRKHAASGLCMHHYDKKRRLSSETNM